MKIVIDIDDELYEGIERRDGALETEYVCDELMKAVDTGTVLPKGHGRLIDANALKEETYTMTEWNGDVHQIIYKASLDDAPTIIEEDKEVSE